MSFSETVLQLFLISWFTLYTFAANRAKAGDEFWQGFLDPFNRRTP